MNQRRSILRSSIVPWLIAGLPLLGVPVFLPLFSLMRRLARFGRIADEISTYDAGQWGLILLPFSLGVAAWLASRWLGGEAASRSRRAIPLFVLLAWLVGHVGLSAYIDVEAPPWSVKHAMLDAFTAIDGKPRGLSPERLAEGEELAGMVEEAMGNGRGSVQYHGLTVDWTASQPDAVAMAWWHPDPDGGGQAILSVLSKDGTVYLIQPWEDAANTPNPAQLEATMAARKVLTRTNGELELLTAPD